MATQYIKFTGPLKYAFVLPEQVDRAYEDPENGRGGSWHTKMKLSETDKVTFKALGTSSKFDEEGYVTFRRTERHPKIGELGPVTVTFPEGATPGPIGDGSVATATLEVYSGPGPRGKPYVASRLKELVVTEFIPYVPKVKAVEDINLPPEH